MGYSMEIIEKSASNSPGNGSAMGNEVNGTYGLKEDGEIEGTSVLSDLMNADSFPPLKRGLVNSGKQAMVSCLTDLPNIYLNRFRVKLSRN
ncbi:hypothetical protein F0562_018024 [Nyssa sinensis]|uniref:Uncharacterized protein n=1 Tax=Nyssa sinensis TaxID=561372 RepID=A0A5J4Z8F8_9ASTE|nr:hypothetical protein F0562_018024 [Nyssa sinensis]